MSRKVTAEDKLEIFNKLTGGKRPNALRETGKIVTGKIKEIISVAEDQNWRTYVANEIKAEKQWSKDWGFLVKSNIPSCLKSFSRNAFD